jgi:putative hemolysin
MQQYAQVHRGCVTAAAKFTVSLANGKAETREAQRLRFRVFAEEMGARLPNSEAGIDHDMFDPFCDHLLVRDTDNNEVVGTHRILRPERAKQIGGYYAENEFDLTRLANLRSRMVEVGRSCVHPEYRCGAVIPLLWSSLAQYMQTHHYEYLMGCASISMADGGHAAASIYNKLKYDSLAPMEWRVFPRHPLHLAGLNNDLRAALPPLINGYMRAGASVCGDPAWDPDFNTADLLLLLPMSMLSTTYARHFLGRQQAVA